VAEKKKARLRAAVYARFSADKQGPSHQHRRPGREPAGTIAAHQSFVIQERHVFQNHALSGATSDRPGHRKAAIKAKEMTSSCRTKPLHSRASRPISHAL